MLKRVKTYRSTTPESRETDVTLLSALGSDGKPYVLNVDESTGELPVTLSGTVSQVTVKFKYFHDNDTVNINTSAWLELTSSLDDDVKEWSIFDGSGEVLELGVGEVGSEVSFALILPGGGDVIKHKLASGSRVCVRAVSDDATSGYFAINAWS